MSTIRDPAYITNAGRTMMTAGGEVTYTKAVLYGQDISGLSDSQIKALTSLGNPLREVKIGVSDKQNSDSGSTVILEAVFQNNDLKADLQYKAVGFFARKNDVEQLVIVAVANQGAYLAATNPDGVATDALDLKIAVKIGDATSVTAVVDPAGSVTPATLNGAINKLDHDITAKIDANQDSTAKALDTKADKTTVADQLATKANQSDLDKTNAEVAKKADSADVTAKLDTKADKTDVANSVKQLQAGIDSKADKSVVDAEIAKIDFTPYAKTVDVNSKLASYTTTADLTKLLAGKRDISDSYSRAELDKKLLEMSADTDGKVNADQVANMIAGKADKTAVDAELAKKDDTTDVDAKIKTVTDLANTKANASDVYTQSQLNGFFSQRDTRITGNANLINQINSTRLPLYQGSDGEDLKGFFTPQIRMYRGNGSVKNIPKDSQYQSQCFGTLIVLPDGAGNGNDGSQIWISPERKAWIAQSNGQGAKSWSDWSRFTLDSDLSALQSTLQNQITNATNLANQASQKVDSTLANSFVRKQGMNANGDLVEIRGNATKQPNGGYSFDIWSSDWTASKLKDVLGQLPSKANSSDVSADISNLQSQINSKTSGTIITAYDIASKNPTKETNSYTNKWLVDQNVLSQFADAINSINSTRVPLVNGSGDDDLFAFKTNQIRLYPGNGKNCKNLPPASNTQWFTVQYVFENPNGDGVAIFRSPANEVWMVGNNGGSYTTGWTRLANSGDISNLQNIINQQNQTIQSLTTRLTNAENEIRYIKANYVEGRTFPASQEAQANSWENENPQRIAFITK